MNKLITLAIKTVIIFLILLLPYKVIFAQSGFYDSSFDPGTGFVLISSGPGSGNGGGGKVLSTAIQGDDKIIVVGQFTSFSGTARNGIARLNANGSLDNSFVVNYGFDNYNVYSTALQSDGKIIAGGDFIHYNGTTSKRIVRLNSNGSFDTGFNTSAGFDDVVYSVSIQSDGKIIAGGNFTTYNNNPGFSRIARLNSNGTVDTGFNIGTGFNDWVWTTAIQSDGKIIVGGNFSYYNGYGTPRNKIIRLNSNGTVDTGFNTGTGFDFWVRTIAIQSDGKIVVGGAFTSYNGTPINRIARLNVDGTLDNTFNPGTGFNGLVYPITIQGDGKIVVGGNFTSFNGTARNYIARLNANGSLDSLFGANTQFNDEVYSTALQSDGKIIVGGRFYIISNNGSNSFRNKIGRLIGACSSSTGTDVITDCDSHTWINGVTYTSSNNTATDTLSNVIGCDSIVTLNLTINYSNTGTDVINACDSHTWIDGVTYTSSNNTATYTLTNASGCDSTVTLNLTINYSNTGTDVITDCGSHTWINGITYTSSNNTASFTMSNSTGCDSVITLNLTIHTPPVVTLGAFNNVCKDWPSFNLTGGSPVGGVYTGQGITGNLFNPNVAGAGTHIITYTFTDVNSCESSDNSSIIVSTCTEVMEVEFVNSFSISPNPFSNSTMITVSEPSTFRLYDMQGMELRTINIEKFYVLDRGDLVSGIYFYTLGSAVGKLIINNY